MVRIAFFPHVKNSKILLVYFKIRGSLGALYELERESIKERQREGIDVALESGVKFGRPKQEITDEFKSAYKRWKAGDLTAVAAMKELNMKPNTFYRRVKEYEGAY